MKPRLHKGKMQDCPKCSVALRGLEETFAELYRQDPGIQKRAKQAQ